MKKSWILWALIALFFTSCEGWEEFFEDSDEKELLDEVIIDQNGGVISNEDFQLIVPPGAFSQSEQLSLYIDEGKKLFEEEQISSIYYIEGLPEYFTKPLRVKIRQNGTTEGDIFLSVSSTYFARSLQDETESVRMIQATDSSGYIIGDIDVTSRLKSSVKETGDGGFGLGILAVSNYLTRKTEHFTICYPSSLLLNNDEPIEKLADALEFAYDTLSGIGFTYSSRTYWPVEVTVKKLKSSVYGYSTRTFPWTKNCGVLELNSEKMNEIDEIITTAGHEFFHLVQDLYNTDDDYTWIAEASAVWFEGIMAKNSSYTSSIRAGHELTPFNGLSPKPDGDHAHHGYGMSALFKYLVEENNVKIVSKIYDQIKLDKSPGSAINLANNDIYSFWWEKFYRQYILGKIYNDVSPLTFSTGAGVQTFEINHDGDTAKSFEGSIQDLSGKLFVVKPKYEDLEPEFSLEVSSPEKNRKITAFKYKGNNIEYLTTGEQKVVVPDLAKMAEEKAFILILLTNTNSTAPGYNSTENYTLNMRLNSAIFNVSDVTSVHVGYLVFHDNAYLENGIYTHDDFSSNWEGKSVDGTFQNNVFNGTKKIPPSDMTYGTTTVSIRVEVDPSTGMIKSLYYHDNWEDDMSSATNSATLRAKDLPVKTNEPGAYITYEATGKSVCDYITGFSSSWSGDYGKGNRSGIVCDEGVEFMSGNKASLVVVFYK
jgi:hypothetical protein